MKIRLVDHDTETDEAHWGTCELCESTGEFDYTTLKLQVDGSDTYWVDAWYYEPWYGPVGIEISNLYDFAVWLSNQDFDAGTVVNTELLIVLANEYELDRSVEGLRGRDIG